MTVALTAENVTLTYPDGAGRLTALDRVNLHVTGGSVAAVTGSSGSGKSSLLAVVSTLTRPDSGRVLLETDSGTVDLTSLGRRAAATVRRSSVGIVFQQPNLLSALTAIEQLEVTARLGRRSRTPTPADAKHGRRQENSSTRSDSATIGRNTPRSCRADNANA